MTLRNCAHINEATCGLHQCFHFEQHLRMESLSDVLAAFKLLPLRHESRDIIVVKTPLCVAVDRGLQDIGR